MANTLRNIGKGLARGITADVLGMPVDTLNMLREGLLSPAAGGNPSARVLGGLLGPVQQTGSGDWFAQQMGLPQGEGLAYEAARMLAPSPAEVVNLARRVPLQELITYHGTPHRFEPTPENPLGEFRASQIGTGEGEQAYGHGIYLAETPDVAKQYKETLSDSTLMVNGKPFVQGATDTETAAIRSIAAQGYDNAIKGANQMLEQGADPTWVKNYMEDLKRNKGKSIEWNTGGSLYTADLPDEMVDRMLDWDKPLSEQPKEIRALINKTKSMLPANSLDDLGGDLSLLYGKDVTPSQFLNTWEALAGFRGAGEKALKEVGVPGVKYLDAGSRGAKEKTTRNFVVFPGEEKKVKILKRE